MRETLSTRARAVSRFTTRPLRATIGSLEVYYGCTMRRAVVLNGIMYLSIRDAMRLLGLSRREVASLPAEFIDYEGTPVFFRGVQYRSCREAFRSTGLPARRIREVHKREVYASIRRPVEVLPPEPEPEIEDSGPTELQLLVDELAFADAEADTLCMVI